MKKFIKILAFALVLAISLSFSACLSEGGSSQNGGNTNGSVNGDGGKVDPKNCSHEYGDWKVTLEPTCKAKGRQERECPKCGTIQGEALPMSDHTPGEWVIVREATCETEGERKISCTVCNATETEKIEIAAHKYNSSNICTVCDDRKFGTEGLSYEIQTNKDPYPGTYKVSSIGDAILEKNIYIASEYNGKAVTYIAEDAFSGHEIESVVIPKSVKEIHYTAFTDCANLKSVTFRKGSELKVLQGFLRCTALTSITVPASVERVAVNAFRGCTALNSISFELKEGWYCGYHNSPRSEPTSVTDTYQNANIFKIETGQYYYFRLVSPD